MARGLLLSTPSQGFRHTYDVERREFNQTDVTQTTRERQAMQKIKKAGMACAMRPATLPQAEQVLLSHVEMCYSVALALTRDPILGQRLARATLLWAWQRQATTGDLGGDVKMALLRELRSRFLRDYYPACNADVRRKEPYVFPGKGDSVASAARTAVRAETCKVG
jgi:hypothetical protein